MAILFEHWAANDISKTLPASWFKWHINDGIRMPILEYNKETRRLTDAKA